MNVSAGMTAAAVVFVTCVVPTDASAAADGDVVPESGAIDPDATPATGAFDAEVADASSVVDAGTTTNQVTYGAYSMDVGITIQDGTPQVGWLNWTMWNSANTYTGVAVPNEDSGVLGEQLAFFVVGGLQLGSCTMLATGLDSNGVPCVGTTAQSGVVVIGVPNEASTIFLDCDPAEVASASVLWEGVPVSVDGANAFGADAEFVCSGPIPNACVGATGGFLCTNLQSDANNCGSCGTICSAPTPACVGGSCFPLLPPPLTPCTAAPCASDTVQCQGNTSPAGVCTATEALFVQLDINRGIATSGGADPANGCYSYLLKNDCVDNSEFGDTGKECGDVAMTAIDGESGPQSCLDNLDCMLAANSSCANANPPTPCFCGTADGVTCWNAGAANGPCLQQEINGLPGLGATCTGTYPSPPDCTEGDAPETLNAFTDTALPAGMANVLLGCAAIDCASECE